MEQSRLKEIIAEWIGANGKKFKGETYEITPARQPEALFNLFSTLKAEGAPVDMVLARMADITSPLAPKNVKTLKMIERHSRRNDQEAAKTLSKWCRAAASTTARAFNEVFFNNSGEEQLSFQPIYEGMCRKRNIQPFYGKENKEELDKKMIEEHLNSPSFDNVKITKSEENKRTYSNTEKVNDSLEEMLKKYKPLRPNPENKFEEYPEVSGFDEEALEFFGLSNVPKEKL